MGIALLVFFILLLMRVQIAIVLGIASVVFLLFSGNTDLLLSAPQQLFSGLESFSLLAIPLFMLAGELMNSGGLTKRLIDFAKALVGHFRGGLAYVNLTANMFLASIIGSASAQIAMMSRVMTPHMEAAGYKRGFSLANTASAGMLGPIIPPSMLFIIYAVGAQQSVGKMFMAGIIPGVVLFLGLFSVIAFIGYKQKFPVSEKASWKDRLDATLKVIPAFFVPGIMIWGIVTGVFTPTESAAIGCIIALIIGFVFYRELKIKDVPKILVNTAVTTSTVTLLISMANLFGWTLTFERVPHQIAQFMANLTDSPIVFLLLVNVFLILLGMFFDGIAALIILVPIFIPMLPMYDIDPIHFGVMMALNLTIGLLTPPVGAGLFIASSIGGAKFEEVLKAVYPFLIVSFIVLLLITYIPELSLWLPNRVGE